MTAQMAVSLSPTSETWVGYPPLTLVWPSPSHGRHLTSEPADQSLPPKGKREFFKN